MYQSDFDLIDSPASVAVPPIAATDGERLMRFRRQRDEAALAEVVEAHAAMVWGVCSQVLRRRQDVEDAFQATFLILARKAGSIRAADSAAGWLYRVAYRTSLLVRSQQQRRAEQPLIEEPASAEDQLASLARHEERLTLLEELHALPERYRQPLVLCYFEGKSRREAADELGVTAASVKGLLARGTRMLRTRMVRRGAALSTAMAAASAAMVSAPALAAPQLAGATAALATSFALKSTLKSIGGAVKTSAAVTLAEKGILAMTIAAAAKPAAVVLAIGLTAGLLGTAVAEKPENRKAAAVANPVLLAEAAPAAAETSADEAEAKDVPVTTPESRPTRLGNVVWPQQENYQIHATGSLPNAVSTGVGLDLQIDPTPLAQVRAVYSDPVDSGLTVTFTGEKTFNSAAEKAAPPEGAAEEGEASNAAVGLEIEYWNLKASGLEKKAKVMESKAAMLKESGQAPMTEIMEMEAEAMLTRAEVKLCQSNSLRLKEAVEQRDQRRAAGTSAPRMMFSTATETITNPRVEPATAPPVWNSQPGTPQPPVPAALPWTPQPAAAIPSTPAPAMQPAAPQTNRARLVPAAPVWNGPAPETYEPQPAASPSGWAVQAYATNPSSSRFVVVGEPAEEMKRKFDAKRAANPQLSDAEFLRAFVNEKLMELQTSNALRLTESQPAYRAPQPMLEAPATLYPAPPLVQSPSTEISATESLPAQETPFDEFTRLKIENTAIKKVLEARNKTGWAPMPSPEELAKLREENTALKKQFKTNEKAADAQSQDAKPVVQDDAKPVEELGVATE